MEEPQISKENQSTSPPGSRIKTISFYTIVIAVFIAGLSPSFLPTYFYFTSEKFVPRNHTPGRNLSSGYNSGDSSYCNKPLIPQASINRSICVPPCGWNPFTRHERFQINATTYTSCIIAVISLILILTTWCKVPQLWKFPHFVIVIMLAESTTVVTLVSVATLLGDDLFCSSKFLKEATQKATPFCMFEGAILHYLEGSISLWFVVYNVVVAKGLAIHNYRPTGSSKWPFIISAAVCWLLPVIPVIVVLTSSDGYAVPFYASYCFPSSAELYYYTAVLPENVLYAIGVSFLFVIIWKLLKERQAPITASHDQAKIRKNKMDNVVKRLSLLMVFYAVTVSLTYVSMAYLLHKEKALKKSLELYFFCLNFRPNCPRDYKDYVSHIPLVLMYIAAGIFPLATVLFLAANERTRKFWKKPFYQIRSYISRQNSSTKSSPLLVNDDGDDDVDDGGGDGDGDASSSNRQLTAKP